MTAACVKAEGKNMECVIKHFSELSRDELFEIYKLRVAVFVVEQQSPYPEVDDADPVAYHIWFKDQEGILAYARVLPAHTVCETVSIGRIIAVKRRCGLGTKIVAEAIRVAEEMFGAETITITAQTYAKEFYEKSGFVQCSAEYLDAGVPHIKMIRKKK